jgi:hypothetical protein
MDLMTNLMDLTRGFRSGFMLQTLHRRRVTDPFEHDDAFTIHLSYGSEYTGIILFIPIIILPPQAYSESPS